MNPDRLNGPNRLGGAAMPLGRADLRGWKLSFNIWSDQNGSAAANIEPAPDGRVVGVLYETPDSLVVGRDGRRSAMDRIERDTLDGGGNYEKRKVAVEFEGETREAWTYIGTQAGVENWSGRPAKNRGVSQDYFNHLLEGAKQFGLPEDYVEDIVKIFEAARQK